MEINLSIEKLRGGDEAELERLYRRCFPSFLSFTLGFMTGDEDASRDIVQEVFIAYWQRRRDFTDMVALKVFFYRSLRNRCLNELRTRQARGQADMAEAERMEALSTLEEAVFREEVAAALHNEIETLPPQARRVLLLALKGRSNQEIAAELQLSVNTVKTHKLHAYQSLRLRLKDLYLLLALVGV